MQQIIIEQCQSMLFYQQGLTKLTKGRITQDENLLNQAIACFDKALKHTRIIRKYKSLAQYWKAVAYLELKNDKEGETCLKLAMEIDQTCVPAINLLAKLKKQQNYLGTAQELQQRSQIEAKKDRELIQQLCI